MSVFCTDKTGMKVYERKKLTTLFIVSAVLSVAQIIAMAILGGGMSAFGDSLGVALIILVCGLPLLPFVMMALLLNWKKILIGMIAPIPILSMMKQWYINGIIYAVKAFIVIVKKRDRLVICDGKAVIDGEVVYESEDTENV